ncbi:hypothetical protein BJ878DRAFT_483115 [Calycina marina]|uniref:Uncharacterized protein n=1 Tax=Calycina marina TaxID=1763456 RepID=A0A9P7YWX6_9HELO|nr:hypothetical protein BJ878DRAFT_483115 [Calycina marina]
MVLLNNMASEGSDTDVERQERLEEGLQRTPDRIQQHAKATLRSRVRDHVQSDYDILALEFKNLQEQWGQADTAWSVLARNHEKEMDRLQGPLHTARAESAAPSVAIGNVKRKHPTESDKFNEAEEEYGLWKNAVEEKLSVDRDQFDYDARKVARIKSLLSNNVRATIFCDDEENFESPEDDINEKATAKVELAKLSQHEKKSYQEFVNAYLKLLPMFKLDREDKKEELYSLLTQRYQQRLINASRRPELVSRGLFAVSSSSTITSRSSFQKSTDTAYSTLNVSPAIDKNRPGYRTNNETAFFREKQICKAWLERSYQGSRCENEKWRKHLQLPDEMRKRIDA